jgi:hypothetical protein
MKRQPLDLSRAAEDLWRKLGNPVVIIDTSYRLLAASENPVHDDPLWNELLRLHCFSPETVDYFQRARFVAAVAEAEGEGVALLRDEALQYDRACAKFFDADGVQLGSIVVVACVKPFARNDFAHMSRACARIGRMAAGIMMEQVFHETLICELLGEGPAPANGHAAAQLRAANPSEYWFVCLVDVTCYDSHLSHLAYFRDMFAQMLPAQHCFLHLNHIVVLAGVNHTAPRPETDLPTLSEYCAAHQFPIGASGAFQELRNLRQYYRQALQALEGDRRLRS